MRIERTAKTVIAGLMSVACLASVAACGPGSSSNKANTETEAVSTDLGDTKYELKLWDGAGLKTFDDQLIEAFQKKYPNIKINWWRTSEMADYQKKLQTSMAGGEGPDVFGVQAGSTVEQYGRFVDDMKELAEKYMPG